MTLMLNGSRVRVRPLGERDADTLWRVSREGVDGFLPEPEPSREAVRRRLRGSGRAVDGRLDLAIEAEGRLVGQIDTRRPGGPLPDGVFEIGIALYRGGDRRRGYGREALTLLLRRLFDERGAARIQASTDTANRPMRGLLTSLGFVLEGVMRDLMPGSDRDRRDVAMYAMTRNDYERTRKTWT